MSLKTELFRSIQIGNKHQCVWIITQQLLSSSISHTKLTQIREERKLCLSVLQNGGKMLKARMDLSTCFLHLGSMLALSVMGAAQL
jgi:hypothetical protein